MKKILLTTALSSLTIVTCFGAESFAAQEEREQLTQLTSAVATLTTKETLKQEFLKALGKRNPYAVRYEVEDSFRNVPISIRDLYNYDTTKEKRFFYKEKYKKWIILILYNLEISSLDGLQEACEQESKIKNAQAVWLHQNNITAINSGDFKQFNGLKELALMDNQITTLTPEMLTGLGFLEKLFLSDNQLTTIKSNTFAELQNLSLLSLGNNPLTTLEPNAFAGLKELQYLNLSHTEIDEEKFLAHRTLYGLNPDCVVVF